MISVGSLVNNLDPTFKNPVDFLVSLPTELVLGLNTLRMVPVHHHRIS